MFVVLSNTLSRQKEVFQPQNPDHVGMYVCGPTVYDTAHIGNARSVVVFDMLYRLLQHVYPKVTYVRNITDIDDKIIDAARKNQEGIESLTQRTTQKFHTDMAALGTLPPTLEPRATDHIPQMITLIQSLITQGHAYVHEGHVLFAVESFANYGHLSGLSLEEQRAGARVEVAPYKQNPADFVLWKPSPQDPFFPGWESPWGYGRPGWHIECSAMSAQYLDVPFDIHGGGQDLIFPHHENEIAQSCCALNVSNLAQLWIHNGILTVEGEKMSKSLGNFVTVDQALSRWRGEVIRWVLLSAHYRQSLDWTEDALLQAKTSLDRLYGALRDATDKGTPSPPLDSAFLEILKDDLNTPRAFSYLHALATLMHKAETPEEKRDLAARLRACGNFLGFLEKDPQAWFQATSSAPHESLSEEKILEKIAEREGARRAKDFAMADQLRAELLEAGVLLEDGPQGTFWKRL